MASLKEFFKKVDFEKSLQTTKTPAKLPSRQRVNQSDLSPTLSGLYALTLCMLVIFPRLFFILVVVVFLKINFFKKFLLEFVLLLVHLSLLRKTILNPEIKVFMCDCVFVDGFFGQFLL